MSKTSDSFNVKTKVPPNYLEPLFDFIHQKYILPQKRRFTEISRKTEDSHPLLTFASLDSTGKKILNVEIKGDEPINVKIKLLDEAVAEAAINEVKQDITIAVKLFEEKIRKSTLYFAWREGEEIVPEKLHGREKKPINRIFLETQIFLFVLFIGLGMFLFVFIGWLAPVILLALQLVLVFYSNKLVARTADWRVTEANPIIHLLEYRLPTEEHDTFRKISRDKLTKLKNEVYEQTISKKGEIDCKTAHQTFLKYGFECKEENLSAKKVNVYNLVKKATRKFGFPMPEVVVSNTVIPNAAASGPSPSRGVVLVTTGLLVQLEDDEILSVLGHEFGHLKGRDPLVLFGLTSAEFLFRFYILLPFFPLILSSLLFFLYFWAVMTAIYFIAKFFEARADLVSAITIGQPQTLARALEKIGFRRLLFERSPSYRFQKWISLEPHPPLYFRINRLEKLESQPQIKYLFIKSAKEVTKAFLTSF